MGQLLSVTKLLPISVTTNLVFTLARFVRTDKKMSIMLFLLLVMIKILPQVYHTTWLRTLGELLLVLKATSKLFVAKICAVLHLAPVILSYKTYVANISYIVVYYTVFQSIIG